MELNTIVVGADFAETGDEAIRIGLQQLASGVAHAMYVVHVLALRDRPLPPEEPGDDQDARTIPIVAESLARRVSIIAQRERLPYHQELVRVEVRSGDVRAALLATARDHHANLIIVGTHGRQGLNRVLSGSVAETLIRTAECSVLVARPDRRASLRVEREPSPPIEPDLRTQAGGRLERKDPEAGRGELPWRHTDDSSSSHSEPVSFPSPNPSADSGNSP